jgi:hypothetical protein
MAERDVDGRNEKNETDNKRDVNGRNEKNEIGNRKTL